jgi:hypothetical protein
MAAQDNPSETNESASEIQKELFELRSPKQELLELRAFNNGVAKLWKIVVAGAGVLLLILVGYGWDINGRTSSAKNGPRHVSTPIGTYETFLSLTTLSARRQLFR